MATLLFSHALIPLSFSDAKSPYFMVCMDWLLGSESRLYPMSSQFSLNNSSTLSFSSPLTPDATGVWCLGVLLNASKGNCWHWGFLLPICLGLAGQWSALPCWGSAGPQAMLHHFLLLSYADSHAAVPASPDVFQDLREDSVLKAILKGLCREHGQKAIRVADVQDSKGLISVESRALLLGHAFTLWCATLVRAPTSPSECSLIPHANRLQNRNSSHLLFSTFMSASIPY